MHCNAVLGALFLRSLRLESLLKGMSAGNAELLLHRRIAHRPQNKMPKSVAEKIVIAISPKFMIQSPH
jgi:hypothetical protein